MPLLVERSHGDSISGGYLANAQIVRWAGLELVESDAVSSLRALLDSAGREPVLLDSIFLYDPALDPRDISPRSRVRLLAHSLPSLLPGRSIEVRLRDLEREVAVLSRLAGAIAPSRFLAQALIRRGMAADRIAVIPLAPIADGRSPGARGAREHNDLTIEVVSVAHVVRSKGYPDAARALVRTADLRWRWTIVGRTDLEPDCVSEVRRTIETARLEDRVNYIERREPAEMASVYKRSDLLLLPSYMESFGLAFAEAMSHGIPAVGYRVAAVPEVVGDGGLLTRAGCPDELADAVRAAALDGPARLRARAAGERLPRWREVGTAVRRVLEGDDR